MAHKISLILAIVTLASVVIMDMFQPLSGGYLFFRIIMGASIISQLGFFGFMTIEELDGHKISRGII